MTGSRYARPVTVERDRPPVVVRVADMVLRVIGGVVATWGAVLLALIEVFLVPLRILGVRAPVTLLVVVVGNIGLMVFARYTTRNRLVGLLPGLAWFAVTLPLSGQTAAGDTVLVGDDWVPLALLGLGALSVAVGAYLSVLGARRPR